MANDWISQVTLPNGTIYDLKALYTKAADITSTTNAIAYYSSTTGTFASKASANGALYATTANGALSWGTLPIAQGGTGKTTGQAAANYFINSLDTGASDLSANDYVITQFVGGGSTTTTYHRRPASKVINATLVKAALGTTGTTAKKFLKDTGSWAQVAWGDLTGIPSASANTAGIIKIGATANDALAGNTLYAGSDSAGGAATKVKLTTHTNTTNGNKTYYMPFSTTTTGGVDLKAHTAIYLYETVSGGKITNYDFCFGAAAVTGSITLWDGSSNWGNIKPTGLSANRNYTLPNASGTIALTNDFSNVSNNATLNGTTGTLGDMLYWSAANTPARLSIGTEGKILKSDGSVPNWEDEYKVEIIRNQA